MGTARSVVLAIVILVAAGMATARPARAAAPERAPEFTGISHWINSPPLTMRKLRGKVVLIDFWAYSCINCLRTFPHINRWYAKYKDHGLVVVGVHSPEFKFGMQRDNVEAAVKRFHLRYPVAMDSRMATWNAWNNQFWPAEYLVDRHGNVVQHHYGEGHYEEMENAIRHALGLAPLDAADTGSGDPDFAAIGSPEMYFGLARVANMANTGTPTRKARRYRAPERVDLNRYALDGTWRMSAEYAELASGAGRIHLRFKAAKLHMVAASDKPVTLAIRVDGKKQPPVTVQASRLYTLFDSDDYAEHDIVIDIPHAGLRAYTFTFG